MIFIRKWCNCDITIDDLLKYTPPDVNQRQNHVHDSQEITDQIQFMLNRNKNRKYRKSQCSRMLATE